MAILKGIACLVLGAAALCFGFYLRFRIAVDHEERRDRKSGLQGLFKKTD